MSDQVFWRGTLAEMIDKDILDHGLLIPGEYQQTDGFSIGTRGRARFWMWDPTPNGFYKIYEQNERGDVIGVRYVDANKTMVSVWKNKGEAG